MFGSILGALVAFVLLTAPFSTPTQAQSERHSITLNGFAVEVLGNVTDRNTIAWERDAQSWKPCPPLMADPGGVHSKARYAIEVNGRRAEVLGWVDPDGFKWLHADQTWGPSTAPQSPPSTGPTAAMANGVVVGKLDREGKVTASDHQTQAAVESLIESADAGRLKPPSLKKPSLLPAIPWGWILASLLAVASLGFVGLAFILALWLLLKRTRS